MTTENKDSKKKPYKKPIIKSEKLEEASAQGQGSGGGNVKTCNGTTQGGRKDTAAGGCNTLLT